MSYSIVYSSQTGNTKQLAETLRETLPQEGCRYFGTPAEAAAEADTLYVGFWTDKGTCDETIAAFLQGLAGKRVFLFGTAGFGGARAYFDQILASAAKNLPEGAVEIGRFMCQGKMQQAVRDRYVKMKAQPDAAPNLDQLIDNFDRALSHPDAADLENLRQEILK